jgi:nitroreductase
MNSTLVKELSKNKDTEYNHAGFHEGKVQMDVLEEIQNRRTATAFLDKTIPKETLERVLEAGRLAPSAKNRQPWRFIVIKKQDLKEKVMESAYGQENVGQASVVVALCTTNIDYKMPNGQLAHPIDLSFACSFMMLQAEHEGLGTNVVTTFDEEQIKTFLSVPHSMRIVMLLLIGYSAVRKENSTRYALKRITSTDHW